MIEATLIFAFLTGLFELILLAKLKPRLRLRVLNYPGCITTVAFCFNLWIHFGTVTGTMTAVIAGLASMGLTSAARWYWGYISGRCYYFGVVRFPVQEVK